MAPSAGPGGPRPGAGGTGGAQRGGAGWDAARDGGAGPAPDAASRPGPGHGSRSASPSGSGSGPGSASASGPGERGTDAAPGSAADPAAGGGPRTVLVTGAGGAGRTTVAAATALALAGTGRRTLLLSDEPAAALGAVLGADLPAAAPGDPSGEEPPPVRAAPGLWALQIDAAGRFRRGAAALQARARAAFDLLGSAPFDEDELTELPGADAFALLHALCTAHESGEWDALVLDLPAAGRALPLLGLPAQLRRHLRRLAPPERQAARALRPVLAQLAGVPMPPRGLYEALARWQDRLAAVQHVLDAPGSSVRLVVEPGPRAAESVREAHAGLGLYGLPLDAVVANRLLPADSPDPWLAALSGRQRDALGTLRARCAEQGVPLRTLPHLGRDPRGAADLAELARAAGLADPAVPPGPAGAAASPGDREAGATGEVVDRLADEGLLLWRLALPSARREELDLVRRGDEVVLSVGRHRRLLPLPPALRRCHVAGAALADGLLTVRFAPDPALWPAPEGR